MPKRTVYVFVRKGRLTCDLCVGTDCVHTRYAETLGRNGGLNA